MLQLYNKDKTLFEVKVNNNKVAFCKGCLILFVGITKHKRAYDVILYIINLIGCMHSLSINPKSSASKFQIACVFYI